MKTTDTKASVLLLDDIAVTERIRKDNGTLDELAASVSERGLINPITVMENADGKYTLIAGLRRLEACRLLGKESVRATVLTPMAADEALMLEIAENEQRKEFTVAERLDYAAKLKVVESEKARGRKSLHARDGYENNQDVSKRPHPDEGGRVRDIVAKKAGFTSQQQMGRAAVVAEKRPDLLPKIDSGETTICGAYKEARLSEEDGEPFIPDEALKGVPVVPETKLRRRNSKEERAVIKRIEAQVITAAPVEVEMLEPFNPAAVVVTGSADCIEGAPHDRLLMNPVYAKLFEKYTEAVQIINLTKGELRTRCENYEKRIRAYEENHQTMARTIEKLQSELAARREAQHVGA